MAASMKKYISLVKRVKHVIGRTFIGFNENKQLLKISTGHIKSHPCRCLSASANAGLAEAFKQATETSQHKPHKLSLFRTAENDPTKHTHAHTGQYFKLDEEDYKKYVKVGQHLKYDKMCAAFHEHCIMIRKSTVEILDCIRATDKSSPNIRYVLYGMTGVGKTMSLAHTMTFCGRQGWFVVHFPWLTKFVHHPKEVQISAHNKERVDTPVECVAWLVHFQQMNADLIPPVKLQNSYTWNRRESSEIGTPLAELLEFGLTRPKHSADVIGALMKELRHQSSQGTIRTLVAIDGANELWLPSTISRIDDKHVKYKPEELSIIHNIRKMLMNDWSGGVSLVIPDTRCAPFGQKESYMPRYLFSAEALDHLEPHIPIHIQNYNEKEAHSCLEYFIDRKWIQRPEGLTIDGQREILFLSSQNPQEMYNVCSRW